MKRVKIVNYLPAWLCLAAIAAPAQRIPGRYIIELATPPAAEVTNARHARFSASDKEVVARKSHIAAEHRAIESALRTLGGTVTHRFDTLNNAVAVNMSEAAAKKAETLPNVRGVYPVIRHHKLMDQAVAVHRFTQAYQGLSGGAASAGQGTKIAVLDCGVDVAHPTFQNFGLSMPAGFPVVSGTATQSNVNNKVIVARVYNDVAGGIDNTKTDGLDYCNHGTTVAAIAAGLPVNVGMLGVGTVAGVAPGAWIGNYKVADDSGTSDDVTFLAGMNDAFNDGMNVVNYSYGGPVVSYSDETGPDARAIANAVAGGMVVVASSGNNGPNLGTIATPAVSAAAIAVGAMENQRWFWFGVTAGGTSYYAIPAGEELGVAFGDTSGKLVDVSTVSSDSYACGSLASGLNNNIALIQRGGPGGNSCSFQTKLTNAANAGAIGAIIYDNKAETFFDYSQTAGDLNVLLFQIGFAGAPQDANGNPLAYSWSAGNATLPAVAVSQSDGQALLRAVQANPSLTVDIDLDGKTAMPYPSNTVANFSAGGPSPRLAVKPDIVAVGDSLVAPLTTTLETTGCSSVGLAPNCYSPYTFLDSPFQFQFQFGFNYGSYFDDGAGTSLAAPMVAGAVAILMAAQPGLTGAQYRSMVVNSAAEFDQYVDGSIAAPQYGGAGRLDMVNALQSTLAASVTSVNFAQPSSTGGGLGTVRSAQALTPEAAAPEGVTISNTGVTQDTFAVSTKSLDGVASPTVDSTSFSLAPGASKTITVSFPAAAAQQPGQYHGFIIVSGTQGQTPLRIPYWYGIAGATVQNIAYVYNPQVDPSSCNDAFAFRLMDKSGIPINPDSTPVVTTTAARASVGQVVPLGDIPGTFSVSITTGRADANGNNVFQIAVDGTQVGEVDIQIDNSGSTSCGGGLPFVKSQPVNSLRNAPARRSRTARTAN